MTAGNWRSGLAAALLGCSALTAGCDLGSLAYFVMPESKQPPVIRNLGSENKKVVPKVAILAYSPLETRAEFIHADRQLSDLLGKQLTALCEANGEFLSLVPQRKVEEFKNNSPGWRAKDMAEIGRKLGADFVIYLELNSLSLYEQGSFEQLFRGRANITVTLIDVKNPDETPEQQPFTCTYPSDARGPVPVGIDASPASFRQQFMGYVAKRLSWHFEKYPKRDGSFVE